MSEHAPDDDGAERREVIAGVRVYVPTGARNAYTKQLAPRLATLRGARIGILDNCKEFADLVLAGVADNVRGDYGVAAVTVWRKAYLGIASPYADEMAAQCDAVINGVGH